MPTDATRDGPRPADGAAVVLVDAVGAFRDRYWPLSNFYPHEIVVEAVGYATVEHYFQACKAADPEDRERIRAAATPAEAKRIGRSVAMVDDWQTRSVTAMRRGIAAKFTLESEPGRVLLSTGHASLIEGNDWGDQHWGVSGGRGRNLLGTLLVERRGVLHHHRPGADGDRRAMP